MNISQEGFLKCFNRKVFEKIVKETVIPYDKEIDKKQFDNLLIELYGELKNGKYGNSAPRDFLQQHKTIYVVRNIPLLTIKDEALYYFLVKYLEDDIAFNRVEYTFGGWKLGNALKKKEKDDLDVIQYSYGSYNPSLWTQEWKEFIKISASFALSKEYTKVIKLDISNFYDSINFNILYNRLINTVDKKKIWILDYLMFFLKHWNKKVDNYRERSAGLPQTEFGDQSRLLANLYLQDYDDKISNICKIYNAIYIRYADDQLIFLKDDNWQNIMYVVNYELNKIGLNLNAHKTKILDIIDLINYNLYNEQKLLDENKYNESFNSFYKLYEQGKEKIRFDIYLHRIFSKSIGLKKLSKQNQERARHLVLDKEYLISSKPQILKNIYDNLNDYQQKEFVELLLSYIDDVSFNSYAYSLLSLFKSKKLNEEKEIIEKKIKQNNELWQNVLA